MKREIKFRAWHKKEKKMCDVDLLHINDGAFLIGAEKGEDTLQDGGKTWVIAPENGRYCTNDEFELMQYTGLKDKNGKEVYESDILRNECNETEVVKFSTSENSITIGHGEYGYVISAGFRLSTHGKEFEVIGNIHENPELLK